MKGFVYAEIMGSKKILVSKKTPLHELVADYQPNFKYPVLLAKVNNELCELNRSLVVDSVVEFLDITDINGFRAYQRSIVFLMLCAAKEVLGIKTRVVIKHSINKNYYVEVMGQHSKLTDTIISTIEKRMHQIAGKGYPIKKYSLDLQHCIELCERFGLFDKLRILKYRRTRKVNFYRLSWFYNYFYGYLVHNTKALTDFKLSKQQNGFILQFPDVDNPDKMTGLRPFKKISQVFIESSKWAQILNVDTVGALNDEICKGHLGDIIRISEALHEKKMASIADMALDKKCRAILIAGPSSSGKTTFSNRLSAQLRVNGLKPHIISIDDYFKDQVKTPGELKDDFDFESIDAIDADKLNIDLINLLDGATVNIPSFNFALGKREDKGKYLKLGKNDILVVEGIHGLNAKIASSLNNNLKFKIFVSALTQINVDDHNRIPTTDTRLFRRIVRDYRFRRLNAAQTIRMWPSVAKG
ncbi:MAG: nucleoside kinase, partial [Clostridiales bacterium]|nr:nucleoside kinase [Clostridiales bacterium]